MITVNQSSSRSDRMQIVAAGDISFRGSNEDSPSEVFFSSVSSVLKNSDLAIANLECVLTDQGNALPNKCTLRGSPKWAEVIKNSGFKCLSLANNHIMDYGIDGLVSTIQSCNNVELYHAGAGMNKNEACRPVIIDMDNIRVAFISRTCVSVNSPINAAYNKPGVAFFEEEETKKLIEDLKKKGCCVILSIHWGLEEYNYPSPYQRRLARLLIKAGVDILLGHHSHILQGIERVGKGLVCYSLGNFLFDEFSWSFKNHYGSFSIIDDKLSKENRQGGLLIIEGYGENRGIGASSLLPTIIEQNGSVSFEFTEKRLESFKKSCSKLEVNSYRTFWWFYSLGQEWRLRFKPLMRNKLKWHNFRKIRVMHVGILSNKIKQSVKIIMEKSTNPYD